MTRINVVPVSELSDQHLIAEYRELPSVIKQRIHIDDAPEKYCLGKGHMKWARKHMKYTAERYCFICNEMMRRGFTVNYHHFDLCMLANEQSIFYPDVINDYKPTDDDLELNRNRLIEKYQQRPNWYRWTKTEKPKYMEAE